MSEPIRLQKILSECGVASRRGAEELIAAGKVAVNGVTAKVGDKADPETDRITLDGKPLRRREAPVYLMLHKPRGYITTMNDEMERKCVAELVRDVPQRVYPVGRLDRESEGLLLMTNDGEFANAMMHPSRHVPKTYRVTVRPGITEEQLNRMAEGIVIDGRKTSPAEVRVLIQEPGRVVLQIVLHEGRNREIRKMCEELGLETARLKRIAFGPLRLGMLPAGKWRALTAEETAQLRAAAGLETAAGGAGVRPHGEIRRNRRGPAERNQNSAKRRNSR
jgi:23S rRNA pseudouridine2605 synthase